MDNQCGLDQELWTSITTYTSLNIWRTHSFLHGILRTCTTQPGSPPDTHTQCWCHHDLRRAWYRHLAFSKILNNESPLRSFWQKKIFYKCVETRSTWWASPHPTLRFGETQGPWVKLLLGNCKCIWFQVTYCGGRCRRHGHWDKEGYYYKY